MSGIVVHKGNRPRKAVGVTSLNLRPDGYSTETHT